MKLIVPYFQQPCGADSRLVRLAEFVGAECELLSLPQGQLSLTDFLNGVPCSKGTCLVVNPQVLQEWSGTEKCPMELATTLLSHFKHIFVHALRPRLFDSGMVAALSRGQFGCVREIDGVESKYEFDGDSRYICGPFAGMSFGPANPACDHVFERVGDKTVEQLITIGGLPFMAAVRSEGSEVLFLASEEVADLSTEVGASPLTEYFSRLVPQIMALRHFCSDDCWQPGAPHASIIVDDPLLRRTYGRLNYKTLLDLMNRHNFHTTVAFIPHNFRRSSPEVARMFRENPRRFSLCFHGNDHTRSEFASTDIAMLNRFVEVARHRMQIHDKRTGFPCENVMVFPQGSFSVEAMKVLRALNFSAAVNTVQHPKGHLNRLTIGELAQPAVLRYGGFPLFIRRPSRLVREEEIAFAVFFGKPVLIVEHHEIFERPAVLLEAVSKINSVVPEIHWTGLQEAVSHAVFKRRRRNGGWQVKGYSNTVHLEAAPNPRTFSIEWMSGRDVSSARQVLQNGTPVSSLQTEDDCIRVRISVPAKESHTLTVVYGNDFPIVPKLGVRWKIKAFLRRRLSEIRDNYVSSSPRLMAAARAFQRLVFT